MTTAAVGDEPRNWLADGFRHLGQSFALFFRTAARITTHPREFAAAWAAGEFRAFNPLAFFATAAGVTSTLGVLVERSIGRTESLSTMGFVVQELEPYASYFLLGLLCHALLVPLGARRPWYMTLGMSLFAGGGPATAADIVTYGLKLAVALGTGDAEAGASAALDNAAAASILLANGVFVAAFALGLAGIHRLRLWRIVVALILAGVLLSVIRVLAFKFVIPEAWT